MHVIAWAVDDQGLGFKFANDPAHVGEDARTKFGVKEGQPVFRPEDQVGQQVRVGVRHCLSPLRGLVRFVVWFPRLTPWATILCPYGTEFAPDHDTQLRRWPRSSTERWKIVANDVIGYHDPEPIQSRRDIRS